MSAHISLFDVARFTVSAHSAPMGEGEEMMQWQTLQLFDSKDERIGEITLHLASPAAALPLGDEPPYFGMVSRHLPALEHGERAPF